MIYRFAYFPFVVSCMSSEGTPPPLKEDACTFLQMKSVCVILSLVTNMKSLNKCRAVLCLIFINFVTSVR